MRAFPAPLRFRPPHRALPRDELEAAVGPRTQAIVIDTPVNPIGRTFGDDDLRFLADLMIEHARMSIDAPGMTARA